MNVVININRPDDVIPFSSLIMGLPSFKCKKPDNCGNLVAELRDINMIPDITTIKTKTYDVVSIQDLQEFISYLDQYVRYVQYNIDQRSAKNVILSTIKTEDGRKLVQTLLNNSKFYPECNHGNGESRLRDWKGWKHFV